MTNAQEIINEIEREKDLKESKEAPQEVKIGYEQLREMKIKDICEIENQYNELQRITERGLNNNLRVREKTEENKQESAEDLIKGLK
jgi:hypothetical protein